MKDDRNRPSDAFQEGFKNALEKFDTFAGSTPKEFLAWLWETVKNAGVDLSRYWGAVKRGGGRELFASECRLAESLSHAAPSTVEVAELRESRRRLHAALASLPEECTQVGILRAEGLSWEEIGRRIGRSADAARQLFKRVVFKLKDLLPRDI